MRTLLELAAAFAACVIGILIPVRRHYTGKHASTWTPEQAHAWYENRPRVLASIHEIYDDRDFWQRLGVSSGIEYAASRHYMGGIAA